MPVPSLTKTLSHQVPTEPSVEDRLERASAAGRAEREQILSDVVLDQMPLARSTALRYRDRGEPVDDLIQVASMGLVLAVQRYRPGHGVSFAAYAVPTMTGELRRYFRDHGWGVRPPRRVQELRPRVVGATEELTHELGRVPTVPEIAERLEVGDADVLETQHATGSYTHTSLDAPVRADGSAAPLAETLGSPDERIETVVDRVSVRPLLTSLSSRDQRILFLRYFDGCTQQQIADRIGVTQMQVSRLLSQSMRQLRSMAEAD